MYYACHPRGLAGGHMSRDNTVVRGGLVPGALLAVLVATTTALLSEAASPRDRASPLEAYFAPYGNTSQLE